MLTEPTPAGGLTGEAALSDGQGRDIDVRVQPGSPSTTSLSRLERRGADVVGTPSSKRVRQLPGSLGTLKLEGSCAELWRMAGFVSGWRGIRGVGALIGTALWLVHAGRSEACIYCNVRYCYVVAQLKAERQEWGRQLH